MDDPELPFFNFFNVIEVKPLSPDESREFLISKLEEEPKAVELFSLLESFSVHISDILTEGLISQINLLAGSIVESLEFSKRSKADIKLIEQTLAIYFHKISPLIEYRVSQLSYTERTLIDDIARLPYQFRVRDISSPEKNTSKMLLSLKQKGFLDSASPTSNLYYKLSSSLLRAWLRHKIFRRAEEALK